MGVYIKGMEMPKRCCECRLSTCHSFKERPLCDVLVEYMSYGEWEAKRLDNCPLVPIPPHGGLIEKNAVFKLIQSMPSVDKLLPVEFMKALYEIPTIIEAEEGE